MPEEIENLLEITRIKNLCKKIGIVKVSQKRDGVIFYCEMSKFNNDNVTKILQTYKNRVQFSPGKNSYITLKNIGNNVIKEVKEFFKICE